MQNIQQSHNQIGGLFYFTPSLQGQIISKSNQFKLCYNTKMGSIFRLQPKIQFSDSSSIYSQNGGESGQISINGGGFTYNLSNLTFKDQVSQIGSIIDLNNSAIINLKDSLIFNSKVFNAGGIFYGQVYKNSVKANITSSGSLIIIQNADLFIQYLEVQNCYLFDGSLFKIENTTVTDLNSKYYGIAAHSGAIGSFKNIIGSFNNISIQNAYSYTGGSYYVTEQSGGVIYIDALNSELYLSETSISNSHSEINGGFINDRNGNLIIINKCNFSHVNSLQNGSIIFSENLSQKIDIIQNIIDCEGQDANYDNDFLLRQNIVLFGGVIYALDSSQLYSTNNIFKNCLNRNNGGIYYLENTTFSEINSQFSKISAISGGIYYCQSCQITIDSCIYSDFKANNGGLINIQNNANVTIENITTFNSQAFRNGGLIYATSFSDSNQCVIILKRYNFFNQSYAQQNGGCFYFDNPQLQFQNFQPFKILNSRAITDNGGVFYIKQSSLVELMDSNFTDYESLNNGSFLYTEYSNFQLIIINNTFNKKKDQWIEQNSDLMGQLNPGSFYLKNTNNTIYSNKNIFQNNYVCYQGGAITLINASLVDTLSTYKYNSAISGGAIYCQNCTLNISKSSFQLSEAHNGGAIFIDNHYDQLLLKDISFNNSLSLDKGGSIFIKGSITGTTELNNMLIFQSTGSGYSLFKTQFYDQDSQYSYNSALYGGVFYLDTTFVNLTNTSFQNMYAVSGGVIFIQDLSPTIMMKSLINNSISKQYGGVFYINEPRNPIGASSFNMTYVNVSNTFAGISGESGGVIFVSKMDGVLQISSDTAMIQKSLFRNFKAKKLGSLLYSSYPNFSMTVNKTIIESETNFDFNYVKEKLQSFQADYAGAIYVADSIQGVSSFDNEYRYCYFFNQGAVYTIKDTKFKEINSIYHENAAIGGGVILCMSCEMNVNNSAFFKNYAFSGGVFVFDNQVRVNITFSNFTNNTALKDGGAFLDSNLTNFESPEGAAIFSQSANVQIFLYNNNMICKPDYIQYLIKDFLNLPDPFYQLQSNILINNARFIDSKYNLFQHCFITNFGGVFTLSNTNFQDFYSKYYLNAGAQGGVFYLQQTNASILYSDFDKNIGNIGGVIQMNQNSYLSVKSSFFTNNEAYFSAGVLFNSKFLQTFSDQLEDRIYSGLDKTRGTFIFIITDVDIEIINSQFMNGYAIMGGAVYLSGYSNLKIMKNTFNNNLAFTNGGAIYAVGFASIQISDETNFKYNLAQDGGDDIFVSNTDQNLTLFKVNILNPNAKNSIYAEQCGVQILNSTISNVNNEKSTQGAGLQCFNCRNIQIINSTFSKLYSQLGGALYIEENEVNKKITDKIGKYLIKNSIFENCQASVAAGAIFFNNIQYTTIQSSIFRKNTVLYDQSYSQQEISGTGGAIYYTCDETYLNCNLEFANKNFFQNNLAKIKGGAIYWDVLEPKFTAKDMIFSGNKGIYYGNNIATFSQKLIMINQTFYINLQVDLGIIKIDDLNILRQLSETENYLISRNLQKEGVIDEQQGKIQNQRSGGNIPTIYLAHIDKYGQIQASDNTTGMVQIYGLSFSASPGNKYTISFNSDGIDLRKTSNQEFMKQIGESQSNLDTNIILELRDCDIGEQFTEEGQCIKCPNQQSFSLVKMTSPGQCESCPSDKALCYGGSNVGPRPGFWRTTNSSSLFIQCLYEPACLGMVEPENNPIGSCQKGYQGVLCADCLVGYSRTGDFQCSKCPEKTINIIRLTFIIIALIVAVVIIIGQASFYPFLIQLSQLLKPQHKFLVLIVFQIQEQKTKLIYLMILHFMDFFFALPSIIVWGVGIPAFAYVLMRNFRYKLDQLEVKEMYGFLYRGFRKEFYFWEIVIMYRKMILILVAVFVRSLGVLAQALFVFFLLICTLDLNNLEIVSLVTSMISIYCGMFFITDLPEKWIKENPDFANGAVILDPNTKLAFFIIIVISNAFFFCYWTIKMFEEIMQKLRNSLPKIYLYMCACGDINKLQREKQIFDVKMKNQSIKEQYFIALALAKKQITEAKIVLNQENYERIFKEVDPQLVSKMVQDIVFEEYDDIVYNKRQYRMIQDGLNRITPQTEIPSQKAINFKNDIQIDDDDLSITREFNDSSIHRNFEEQINREQIQSMKGSLNILRQFRDWNYDELEYRINRRSEQDFSLSKLDIFNHSSLDSSEIIIGGNDIQINVLQRPIVKRKSKKQVKSKRLRRNKQNSIAQNNIDIQGLQS
ncbi:UNKNOWN [Stylonychia lemnae]|uniref:Transmembrane protein n=1 Tax=Stylonychia lemnae TaxID=5949 RepID=A0A077ZR46_STYLE|nr:UNKNOWN [Stylonychia lemnae]|eukprot:CDW71929.1 UNKNOWN [Stylonychia lemnae]